MTQQETPPLEEAKELPLPRAPVIVSVTAEKVSAHLADHFGSESWVWRDPIPNPVPLNIHVVAPTAVRKFWVLATSGASERALQLPSGSSERSFIELMVCLPATWRLDEQEFQPAPASDGMGEGDRDTNWPVAWLKYAGRYPHRFSRPLAPGVMIPTGSPLCGQSKMSGMMIASSLVVPPRALDLRIHNSKVVRFHSLWPVFHEEIDFRTKNGMAALWEKFTKAGVSDVIDVRRKNTCAWRLW